MQSERARDHLPAATLGLRRVPQQERSRRRVEQILDATARLVVAGDVEHLTTRSIAEAAGIPVATLYRYFNDLDAVLLALTERDITEMDAQVADAIGRLGPVSVATLVRSVMEAFVAVYHRRPAFVEIYLRGRSNHAIRALGREHNARIATTLREYAVHGALVVPELTPEIALLAVEVGDRVFQLAFEHDDHGDPLLLEEGITMVSTYLERFAVAGPR